MKKVLLTIVVLLMAVLPAFSENVTVQTAQRAAQSFLNSKMEGNPQIRLIDFAEKAEFPNFYVFGNEHCFVIIAGDNCAKPVLGYSTERGFNGELIPDNVKDWLKAYNNEIASALSLSVEATPRIRSEWESLLSGRGLEPKSSTSVNPLITTHWHQYAPYNNLCPADPNASNGHAKAGCGAIAMAQFMNYWEHPISGVGEHSYTPSAHPEYGAQYANFGETVYDWDNMLDSYSNGYNDAEALAVATLVYHCGVSVNMNYGPSGSACNSSVIDDALMTYFDYSPNTEYVFKETSAGIIPDEIWITMLKINLDLEWPLIYRGETEFGEVGHIFICDGYDANDYFHINWGHGNGGGYGGYDGYFAIGSLYENWTNYSYNNAAVFNSIPNYLYDDSLIYSINSDGESVTVTGHVDGTAATGMLTIPETKTFNGITFTVTAIKKNAFSNCSGFTGSLTIPNTVTTIGYGAFYNCSGFTGDLVIPSSVITIQGDPYSNGAFQNCSGFTGNLTISNSVVSIGDWAFSGCNGFTGSLTIGNSVTTIGANAFLDCSGFTGSLTIPNSVSIIDIGAFRNCSGFIGDLIISNSVTEIGGYAFFGCSGLTGSLTIPNSVTTLGDLAFYYCSGFSGNLTIGNSVPEIGNSAFNGCSGFTGGLTIPNSVTRIGCEAFEDCSGFNGDLTIGNAVTEIGYDAFWGCSGFSSIQTLAETAPALGNHAFYGLNHDIPVTVPCGSLGSYQNAYGWSDFTNIQEDCTSLYEEDGDDVFIYPNPVNDFLTVTGEAIHRVMVYNEAGQMIEDRKEDGKEVVQIDVMSYATEAFIVKVFTGNGVVVKRFVKY